MTYYIKQNACSVNSGADIYDIVTSALEHWQRSSILVDKQN